MAITKSSKAFAIILTITALALATSTLGAIVVTQNIPSTGSITIVGGGGGGGSPNIGIYSDSACTINMTSLTWGSVAAGGSTTQTAYVKNTGTATMTLSLNVTSWSPAGASNYITISWNQQGTQLAAGQSATAILTLTVSGSITGISTFSNTITISGTG
jgi:hypothetical protein